MLPKSLFGRTFALLALLVVVSVFAWFGIFQVRELEPRAQRIAQNLISVVNLTRAALVTAQPDKRGELLRDLSQREQIEVYPADDGDETVPLEEGPVLRLASDIVRTHLGPDTRFASARNALPGFWVSFSIEDDDYWVRVPRERVETSFALQWLGWGALALLLSLGAAWWIVSRISRPLRALGSAAAAIGSGRRPALIDEGGVLEFQALSHAFNQMSRDLARLDEDRALILAGVSHDLRTPLARLRLGIEMSNADEPLKQGMNADIEDMDRIIGQFLDFARVGQTDGDTGRGGDQPVDLDLASLAGEIVERQRSFGHDVSADLAPLPRLRFRPLAMRRAISNLVDNALRYGGGEVHVATRQESGRAVVEVSDRGPGIPSADMDRMKQPFTRLENSRSGKGGSGLGLAIVDRIARLHGGSLELSARPGGGLSARLLFRV
jgi:two-component system osmolarity sensor histidine kinase EnvZ